MSARSRRTTNGSLLDVSFIKWMTRTRGASTGWLFSLPESLGPRRNGELHLNFTSKIVSRLDNGGRRIGGFRPVPHEAFYNELMLPQSTGSDSSLDWLYARYDDCMKNHSRCRVGIQGRTWYRKRLLWLASHPDGYIRHCDTNQATDQGYYFTLSHCWGESQPLKLTRETEVRLRAGVAVTELPKTSREAMQVCRRFGINYIWIDSL